MRGLGLGFRLARPAAIAAPFSPLDLSPLVFHDFSDLSALFTTAGGSTPVASDGDPVGRAVDLAGNHNLTAAADANRPVWNTAGGLSWLTFDGVNAFLNSALSLTQPFTLAAAVRVGDNAVAKIIWGGGSSSYIGFGDAEQPRIFAGKVVAQPGSYLGRDVVATAHFSGADSYMRINGAEQLVSGDAGTNGGPSMAAGAFGSGGGNKWVGRIHALAAFDGALTAGQLAQLESWMAGKCGATMTA